MFRRRIIAPLALLATLTAGTGGPRAQEISAYSREIYTGRYPEKTGEAVYQAICQGCHMPDGRGAAGAGTYPSLAGNPRLRAAAYPLSVVANGQKAMPWFGGALTDAQVAGVVNYVRTHFGNHYTDAATAEDARAARHPGPAQSE